MTTITKNFSNVAEHIAFTKQNAFVYIASSDIEEVKLNVKQLIGDGYTCCVVGEHVVVSLREGTEQEAFVKRIWEAVPDLSWYVDILAKYVSNGLEIPFNALPSVVSEYSVDLIQHYQRHAIYYVFREIFRAKVMMTDFGFKVTLM